MTTAKSAHPQIASYDTWLDARKELLAREKEITRARRAERRAPPLADGQDGEALSLHRPRR